MSNPLDDYESTVLDLNDNEVEWQSTTHYNDACDEKTRLQRTLTMQLRKGWDARVQVLREKEHNACLVLQEACRRVRIYDDVAVPYRDACQRYVDRIWRRVTQAMKLKNPYEEK